MDKISFICVMPKQLINYIKRVKKLKVDNMGKITGEGTKCLNFDATCIVWNTCICEITTFKCFQHMGWQHLTITISIC